MARMASVLEATGEAGVNRSGAAVVRPSGVAGLAPGALALEGVSLSFGGVVALDNIDIRFAQNAVHSIIGPNGAGKSSLLNVISGVYKPDRGRVRIGDAAFSRTPSGKLARLGVGRTFQNLCLFDGLSVFDNVASGLSFQRRSSGLEQIFALGRARAEGRRRRERVEEALALLGLEALRDRAAGELSWGLKKKVELARAVVAQPKIILLDEPMAGLTAADKEEMAAFIALAQARLGATVILIEHDVEIVMSLSSVVTVLDFGRKIAEGPSETVRKDPRVIEAYLGVDTDSEDGAAP